MAYNPQNANGQATMANSSPVVMASDQMVSQSNAVVSGTLTASDAVVAAPVGDGTLVTGASSAGSIVYAVVPDTFVSWTLLIKGYVSGTIYTEASNNTTNGTDGDWVEVKGRRTGTAPGTESVVYAMVANGYYRGNGAGFKGLRARLIGGTGPTIQWQLSQGMGATFLNSGIPGGSSNIGSVSLGAGTNTIGLVKITDGTNTATVSSAGSILVSGSAPVNSPPALNPVSVSGVDAAGKKQHFKMVTTTNALVVDGSAVTQPVSISATVATSLATLPALSAGSAIIGKVGIDQTTPGTTNLVALAANQTVNTALINGVAPLMGNGVTGTGSQRVTIASDNTAIPVNASGFTVPVSLVTGTNTIGNVNIIGTVPVSLTGSATSTLQTSGNTSLATLASTVATTYNSGFVSLHGGTYNTGLPALTNTQYAPLQLDVNGRLIVNAVPVDGAKISYSASVTNLVASATTPTDIFTITGSATKLIRITRIQISGTQTTAAVRDILFVKRSAANTGGTFATVTPANNDSNGPTWSAAVKSYTVNATALGSSLGNLRSTKVLFNVATGMPDRLELLFGNRAQAMVLRGVAETLAINLNSVASAGNLINIDIEWTEE